MVEDEQKIPSFRECATKEPDTLILVLVIFAMFFVMGSFFIWSLMNINDIGKVFKASSVNNFMGAFYSFVTPFIALLAVILTYFAFREQYNANKQQKIDLLRERFEHRFYEMLNLHRENVSEINIRGKIEGRKAFVFMLHELKFTYHFLKHIIKTITHDKHDSNSSLVCFSEEKLCKISFCIFYVGVGENSSKMLFDILKQDVEETILSKIIDKFEKKQSEYLAIKEHNKKVKIERKLKPESNTKKKFLHTGDGNKFALIPHYKPFNGHLIRLSHYYRHLFQTALLIHQQPKDVIQDKYFYFKNLRAQLSIHEQTVLYYNSFTEFGKHWYDAPYFTDYALIRNIPPELADIGISPDKHPQIELALKEDVTILEWQEAKLGVEDKRI